MSDRWNRRGGRNYGSDNDDQYGFRRPAARNNGWPSNGRRQQDTAARDDEDVPYGMPKGSSAQAAPSRAPQEQPAGKPKLEPKPSSDPPAPAASAARHGYSNSKPSAAARPQWQGNNYQSRNTYDDDSKEKDEKHDDWRNPPMQFGRYSPAPKYKNAAAGKDEEDADYLVKPKPTENPRRWQKDDDNDDDDDEDGLDQLCRNVIKELKLPPRGAGAGGAGTSSDDHTPYNINLHVNVLGGKIENLGRMQGRRGKNSKHPSAAPSAN